MINQYVILDSYIKLHFFIAELSLQIHLVQKKLLKDVLKSFASFQVTDVVQVGIHLKKNIFEAHILGLIIESKNREIGSRCNLI